MAENNNAEKNTNEPPKKEPIDLNAPSPVSGMSIGERFALARSVGEECTKEEELLQLLAKKPQPTCYDGFEPSGRIHIAQGIMKAISVNKLVKSGCKFIFWVADWFALMNNKMGGDLEKIRTVGRYMIEVWKAVGMDLSGVEFRWAADEINGRAEEYWGIVMDIAMKFNFARIKRCSQIMGRDEEDDLSAAQIMYPCMQCADIFFLKADICQLGMDQRKVNMLAREYCDERRPKIKLKPVILSHHMLMGLKKGQAKMSKSDPDSAIFMEDSEEDVIRKIAQGFCPRTFDENPILDYIKHIVLPIHEKITVVDRENNERTYANVDDLGADMFNKALPKKNVRMALALALNKIIQPVRDHFNTSPEAKALLEQVKSFRVTK